MFKNLQHSNDNRKGLLSKIVSKIMYSRTCRALEALDDRTLYDLGIARNQIASKVRVMMNDNQNKSVAS